MCRISASLEGVEGSLSESLRFETVPGEPDAPQALALAIRSNTHVTLKWGAPASDNGRPISSFLLEYTEVDARFLSFTLFSHFPSFL